MKESDYIERDAFIAYIVEKVNPARKRNGLSEIREHEARECYRILRQFHDNWTKETEQ